MSILLYSSSIGLLESATGTRRLRTEREKPVVVVNFLYGNGSDNEVAEWKSAADGRLCTQELEHSMR